MAIAAVFALGDGEIAWSEVRWWPLVLAATVAVPLTLMTNAAEFALSARFVGQRIGPVSAMRTTLLATAANLLPLPGGAIVRVRALALVGVQMGNATLATLLMAAGWVGVAAALATIGMRLAGASGVVVSVGAGLAVVSLGAGVMMVARLSRDRRVSYGWFVLVLAVELLSVTVAAARILLVMVALGFEASVGVALTLALAGVLANVVGVVPAGLGVREALSAGLAVLVALPASVGFLVSLLDRIVGLVVAAPAAFVVAAATGSAGRDAGDASDREESRHVDDDGR